MSDPGPEGRAASRPVALVTGAGTGIGAACARALDAGGLRVAVHYRSSEAQAREVAAKLSDALLVKADLAAPESLDALVAELKERAGRVDVLVNNAGYIVNGLLAAMKLEDYDAVAAIARGTWYLTKLVLRRFMLRQGSGRIINVSSVVGSTGNPGQTPYAMVKAGLDAFTKSLAQELAGRPILVAPARHATVSAKRWQRPARTWCWKPIPPPAIPRRCPAHALKSPWSCSTRRRTRR